MHVHDMAVDRVPLDDLRQHPDNANNGDVDSIEQSIEVNGFYKPLLVQRGTNYILVGNHSYQAAMSQGATEVPVIYLDVTDLEAKRIMVADNATNRKGFDDEALLRELLYDLATTDAGLFGTGYDEADLHKLNLDLDTPLDFTTDSATDEPPNDKKHDIQIPALSVIPIKDENGVVYEISVALEGMGSINKHTYQQIRHLLGLDHAPKDEIDAYQVTNWR